MSVCVVCGAIVPYLYAKYPDVCNRDCAKKKFDAWLSGMEGKL